MTLTGFNRTNHGDHMHGRTMPDTIGMDDIALQTTESNDRLNSNRTTAWHDSEPTKKYAFIQSNTLTDDHWVKEAEEEKQRQ